MTMHSNLDVKEMRNYPTHTKYRQLCDKIAHFDKNLAQIESSEICLKCDLQKFKNIKMRRY